MARVLVEHGADVNRRDSEGKTVMMVSLSEWPRRADMHLIHVIDVVLHLIGLYCMVTLTQD